MVESALDCVALIVRTMTMAKKALLRERTRNIADSPSLGSASVRYTPKLRGGAPPPAQGARAHASAPGYTEDVLYNDLDEDGFRQRSLLLLSIDSTPAAPDASPRSI